MVPWLLTVIRPITRVHFPTRLQARSWSRPFSHSLTLLQVCPGDRAPSPGPRGNAQDCPADVAASPTPQPPPPCAGEGGPPGPRAPSPAHGGGGWGVGDPSVRGAALPVVWL